jgi:hypothetical protein
MKKNITQLLLFALILFATRVSAQQSRHFLLRDEGLSQLAYIDMSDSTKNWYIPVPTGRDMQLVGHGLVMIGTGNGYEEREIATGNKVKEVNSFPGTVSARRLRNGNTLLVGVNWQGKQGIVLAEINAAAAIQRLIVYPGFSYVRIVRETPSGNFLVSSNDTVFEGNASGQLVWQAKISSKVKPHAWQPLRLANGETIVSSGYSANLQFFSKEGTLVKTITGPDEVVPNFYAGLQILPNGNYVVINWEGHGKGHGATGTQLLEYTPEGKLAWSWKQDPTHFSSLHAVIILDGLDTNQLHVENENGMLAPVK